MRRLAALVIVALVLVLVFVVVAQLVLPGIAEQRLRDRLARSGQVLKVDVEAFPAVELLWHRADRVVVRMARYRANPGHVGSLLGQAGDADSVDASVAQLDSGLLTLRDATLRKRGDELTGRARITNEDLRAAIPLIESVEPIATGAGSLTLRGTVGFLGQTASLDAEVTAEKGQLIVRPAVPLVGFPGITVFSNPHVAVQGVSAQGVPDGIVVSVAGRLR